jgi:hypothetical protein
LAKRFPHYEITFGFSQLLNYDIDVPISTLDLVCKNMNSPPLGADGGDAFADDDFASDDEEFVVTVRSRGLNSDAEPIWTFRGRKFVLFDFSRPRVHHFPRAIDSSTSLIVVSILLYSVPASRG